jgi:hypothetical protein
MRRALWLAAAAAITLIPASSLCQQQEQQASAPTAQPQPKQEDSLAAAARRAREQKKEAAKPAKVFDNDTIPSHGGISTVGATALQEPGNTPGAAEAGTGAHPPAGGAKAAGNDEKAWRKRFADLRRKLEADQQELDIMQRELGVLDVQNYSDPMKGLQEGLTRSDINAKTAKIEEKKKQIAADQQAIADAEEELRKSGGDLGWTR